MRKFLTKVTSFLKRLDTFEARKNVAADLRKAATSFFLLFLASLPGTVGSWVTALATLLKLEPEALAVSPDMSGWLLAAAAASRVLAFCLELKLKDAPKDDPKPALPPEAKKVKVTQPKRTRKKAGR